MLPKLATVLLEYAVNSLRTSTQDPTFVPNYVNIGVNDVFSEGMC